MLSTLLFVSGFAGLLLEVAAMKILALHLGGSAVAAAVVLAGFLGGLGLGAREVGRRCEAWSRPLRALAGCEIAAAAATFCVPVIGHLLGGGVLAGLPGARLALGFACVFLPAFLAGGVVPLALRARRAGGGGLGGSIAALLVAETAGAAAGALAAGFLLLPTLGLSGAIAVSGVLRVAVAGGAGRLERDVEAGRTRWVGRSDPAGPDLAVPLALSVAVAAAALGMVLEVSWFRVFVLVFSSSTYSFAAVLAAVILGLGVGAGLARLRVAWGRPGAGTLAWSFALLAILLAAGVPEIDRLPTWFLEIRDRWTLGFEATLALQVLLAFLVAGPPAAATGFVLPVAAAASARVGPGEAGHLGRVTAAGTLGSVLGVLAATFLLIPGWGPERVLLGVAGMAAVLALGLYLGVPPRRRPAGAGLMACAAVGALAAGTPGWDWSRLGAAPYRQLGQGMSAAEIWADLATRPVEEVFREHGRLATVTVERWPRGVKALRLDGKVEGSTGTDLATQRLLAHLPLLLHPAPRRALVIGLGTGVTAGAAARHGLARVDVCEIEPAVVRAAAEFREENDGVLADPRVHVHPRDARAYLRETTRDFDVVISEPSNPWVAGVAGLYTEEAYARVRARLAPGGVFLQWIHLYESDPAVLATVVDAIRAAFPGAGMWAVGHRDVALIAGRDGPVDAQLGRLRARLASAPGVADHLARSGLTSAEALLGLQLLSPEGLVRWGLPDVRPNTDDTLALEFLAPRAFHRGGIVRPPPGDPGLPYLAIPEARLPPRARREVGIFLARHTGGGLAVRELVAAVRHQPTDGEARFWLGKELVGGGQAAPGIEQLLVAAPRFPRALKEAAEALATIDPARLGPAGPELAGRLVDLHRRTAARYNLAAEQLLRFARAARRWGHAEDADAALRQAVEAAAPGSAVAREARAELAHQR